MTNYVSQVKSNTSMKQSRDFLSSRCSYMFSFNQIKFCKIFCLPHYKNLYLNLLWKYCYTYEIHINKKYFSYEYYYTNTLELYTQKY